MSAASWTRSTTLRILRMEHIRTGNPLTSGWLLKFAANITGDFTAAIEAVKSLPLGGREWRDDEGCWWIAELAMPRLAHLIPAVGVLYWGGDPQKANPPPPKTVPAVPQDIAAAFRHLHLLPSAPAEVVKAAYRVQAHRTHPDHGGTHDGMKSLNRAHEMALTWARRRQGDEDDPPPAA